jgi:hypothetical protein
LFKRFNILFDINDWCLSDSVVVKNDKMASLSVGPSHQALAQAIGHDGGLSRKIALGLSFLRWRQLQGLGGGLVHSCDRPKTVKLFSVDQPCLESWEFFKHSGLFGRANCLNRCTYHFFGLAVHRANAEDNKIDCSVFVVIFFELIEGVALEASRWSINDPAFLVASFACAVVHQGFRSKANAKGCCAGLVCHIRRWFSKDCVAYKLSSTFQAARRCTDLAKMLMCHWQLSVAARG